MSQLSPDRGQKVIIPKASLQSVFDALLSEGYTLVGPTRGEGALIIDEIQKLEDLPVGWSDEQNPGRYRLNRREDSYFFGFVVGPHSWKRYLYPNHLKLYSSQKNGNSFEIIGVDEPIPAFAFIGARACDLEAIAIQDRIFSEGAIQDHHYRARRDNAFILAVNCTEPAATCFCSSMGTGPRCAGGYDLLLTELEEHFLVDAGTSLGVQMLAGSDWRPADGRQVDEADRLMAAAEHQLSDRFDSSNLQAVLMDNLDHRRWDEVAERCLSCASCTLVCPTCFCSDVADTSSLTGDRAERFRLWDSCFNPDFSTVFGGNLRPNIRSRYRQWLTHKLATWHDQFGSSGCVGCGRCITWCPVGIDLREEAAAIRGEVA